MNSIIYDLNFQIYHHPLRKSLQTSHGTWKLREGIILRLHHQNQTGWGEIAPLPWFGSESLEDAVRFCQQLQGKVSEETIVNLPNHLPACQFGFESALADLLKPKNINGKSLLNNEYNHSLKYSYLLGSGEQCLNYKFSQEATFKWKIGVKPINEEIRIFEDLVNLLPQGSKLRLDANGGLSVAEAKIWLNIADNIAIIEFIEQPLPISEFATMLELNSLFKTALALDESVANLQQLEECYQKGWHSIFVIKAAIMGSPNKLRYLLNKYKIDAVFSSVFETKIGRKAVLNLASELSHPDRAVGFGVEDYV